MMIRFRSRWRPLVAALCLSVSPAAAFAAEETTPPNAAAVDLLSVDFVEELNAKLAAGVTPETNFTAAYFEVLPDFELRFPLSARIRETLGVTGDGKPKLSLKLPAMTGADPDAVNGWHEQIVEATRRPWKASERPELSEWVDRNAAALDYLGEETRRPHSFRPLIRETPDAPLIATLLPDVQEARTVAQLFLMRAMRHAGEGRPREAQEDILAARRMSRHVGNGSTLIELLVGYAIEAISINAEAVLLARADYTPELAGELSRELDRLRPFRSAADTLDLCERAMGRNCIQFLSRGQIKEVGLLDPPQVIAVEDGPAPADFVPDFSGVRDAVIKSALKSQFDWAEVMAVMDRQYDELVEAARLPFGPERDATLARLHQRQSSQAAASREWSGIATLVLGSPKSRSRQFAGTLAALLTPALESCVRAQDRAEIRRDLERVAIALTLHRLKHGEYPSSLDGLDVARTDRYSGQPYRYRVEGKGATVWSVGVNKTDELKDKEQYGDDVVVFIE